MDGKEEGKKIERQGGRGKTKKMERLNDENNVVQEIFGVSYVRS